MSLRQSLIMSEQKKKQKWQWLILRARPIARDADSRVPRFCWDVRWRPLDGQALRIGPPNGGGGGGRVRALGLLRRINDAKTLPRPADNFPSCGANTSRIKRSGRHTAPALRHFHRAGRNRTPTTVFPITSSTVCPGEKNAVSEA